jgi:N-sulfoglucosamine sulfohydrolase
MRKRLIGVVLLAGMACGAVQGAAQKRLNVLLITADDLGLQLSCYGDPYIKTPHLDALAASGVRYKTSYIAQSSCSPSRAAIFTGLFPHTNGHIGLAKPGNPTLKKEVQDKTIPALLKKAGYRTGIIGKLHVNPESCFPFDFNVNKDKIGEGGSRNARGVAAQAKKFLSEDASKPFFLMVNFLDPHRDFIRQMDGIPEKPFVKGDVPAWPFQQVSSDPVLQDIADYYNCVSRLDTGVGLLLDVIKALGKENETLVIFLSDNGPPFARSKTTCYEAGLQTPFILRWPGVTKAGAVSDAMVLSVDILPTILDAVGVAPPGGLQGRTLRPVATGAVPGDWRTTLAGEYHQHGESPFFPRRAIRDGQYKLIHNLLAGKLTLKINVDGDKAPAAAQAEAYNGTPAQQAMARCANPPEWELYDLSNDVGEFRNLADGPEYAGTLKRLQGLLLAWQRETQDPFLDPDTLAKRHSEVNAASNDSGKKKGRKN